MVPERLAKWFPGYLPNSFRDCNILGTMGHICWDCRTVKRLWIRTYTIIDIVFNIPLRKHTYGALLNKPIQVIAKPWRTPTLDLNMVKIRVDNIMVMEKLTYILKDKQKLFQKRWSPMVDV
ncbi:hypothetical protein XELAEV_18041264mg [Xenopus laevis]|uniref:Uncharacterized protein n=1 Tax=Xenopus laevis TaxID=8355 RepID=A0A974C1Y6_XENLA|nr:hypothetical protein XELAEV_18041264mg [Xenopus laevis]